MFILTYNFILCKYTILTSPYSNGYIGSSDSLIVVTLEDGHHEGPKHVV
jgi:hypothetical protein